MLLSNRQVDVTGGRLLLAGACCSASTGRHGDGSLAGTTRTGTPATHSICWITPSQRVTPATLTLSLVSLPKVATYIRVYKQQTVDVCDIGLSKGLISLWISVVMYNHGRSFFVRK